MVCTINLCNFDEQQGNYLSMNPSEQVRTVTPVVLTGHLFDYDEMKSLIAFPTLAMCVLSNTNEFNVFKY